jgi:hypothetical protein
MIKRPPNAPEVQEKATLFRPQLGDELEGMLQDFCESHHEGSMTAVVRRAVKAFIESDLARNEGVREAYEALRRSRQRRGKS